MPVCGSQTHRYKAKIPATGNGVDIGCDGFRLITTGLDNEEEGEGRRDRHRISV